VHLGCSDYWGVIRAVNDPWWKAAGLEVAINDHIADAAGARDVGKLRLPGSRNVRQLRLSRNCSGGRRHSLRSVHVRGRIWLGDASLGSPATAGLRQREWDRANCEK
jgi:hypothetical protein